VPDLARTAPCSVVVRRTLRRHRCATPLPRLAADGGGTTELATVRPPGSKDETHRSQAALPAHQGQTPTCALHQRDYSPNDTLQGPRSRQQSRSHGRSDGRPHCRSARVAERKRGSRRPLDPVPDRVRLNGSVSGFLGGELNGVCRSAVSVWSREPRWASWRRRWRWSRWGDFSGVVRGAH
jgi:hypothetical protein